MFNLLSLYIALRYTRAKKRNGFISFISLVSMLGITLGIAVLITVLSVLNGFDYQIKNRIFSNVPQVTVSSVAGRVANWQQLTGKLARVHDVLGVAPFIMKQAMIVKDGAVHGLMVAGIDPKTNSKVENVAQKMIIGKLSALQPGKFGICLGVKLAAMLGVNVGDRVLIITPQAVFSPVGIIPRYKHFQVVGIFKIGGGFGLDAGLAYISLADAQKLFAFGRDVSGLRLKVANLYAAPKVAHALQRLLSYDFLISDWTQQYKEFFRAVSMEKTAMFVILLLIVAVATFNLVSSLVMLVTDKAADIAILRTLGMTPAGIVKIFVFQGAITGILGIIIGVIGGIILAVNAPYLVKMLEHLFHTHFISSSVFLIDYLPSKLSWWNVVIVSVSAFIMSLLATIYPAWRAANIQPAEALRYE
jgi:lipoprotein-releasing system permease protein